MSSQQQVKSIHSTHSSSDDRLVVGDVAFPTLCFTNAKGAEIKENGKTKKGAFQNLVKLNAITCHADGLKTGANIPLAEMWGGRLVNNEPIYSCVQNKTGDIISGLSDYSWIGAQKLPCKENDSTLKQIHMGVGASPHASPELTVSDVSFPKLCFCNDKGEEVKDVQGKTKKGAFQNLVELDAIECQADGLKTGANIPLAEMWGGRLLGNKPVYACVHNKTGKIISGLSDYTWVNAQHLPCAANDSTLHQIHLSDGAINQAQCGRARVKDDE